MARCAHIALVLAALAGPAMAQTGLVSLSGTAQFRSQLYETPVVTRTFDALSVADWDATGRHGQVQTPALPANPVVPMDISQATADFAQEGVGSRMLAYTRASGYYALTATSDLDGVFALTEVTIHNRIVAVNHGSREFMVQFLHTTHGTLLVGGMAASYRAAAREEITVTDVGLGEPVYDERASALVSSSDPASPFNFRHGAWETQSDLLSRTVPGLADPVGGFEIHQLDIVECGMVRPGTDRTFDVRFYGGYESNVYTGFLGFAETDFSHTVGMEFRAVDPVTGEVVPDVTFELVGVPSPGAAALVLGLPLAWRRRRGGVGSAG